MWRRISSWTAEAGAIFGKEWRLELRTRYGLNSVGLFAFTTLVVVSMSLGPVGASEEARPFLPVLLWLILLFAASAGLPRTFVHEEEVGTAGAVLDEPTGAILTLILLYDGTLTVASLMLFPAIWNP